MLPLPYWARLLRRSITGCLLLWAPLLFAELTITTDRATIGADESLQMVLRYDGQVLSGEPELGVLLRDWEIISNNRNQQYSWANGESVSYTEWQLTLLPRSTGKLIIPSLTFKNEISNALEIEVRPSRTASSVAQTIFAESRVDRDTLYPQQQLIYTAQLYSASRLSDLALTELTIDNALLERIGENQYQKTIAGRTYLVVEVQYAIFPSQVGELTIPALRFSGYEVSGRTSFFNRGNRVIRTTQPHQITVASLPSGQPSDRWMPATEVTLAEQWSAPIEQLTVGEPITRTLTLTARGLTGAQLAPLPEVAGNSYKSYPDQAKISETSNSRGVVGQRIESTAIVPQQPGELTLPAITVNWWDTATDQPRQATLAERTVTVVAPFNPAAAVMQPPVVAPPQPRQVLGPAAIATQPPADSRWLQLSLSLNALLLAAIIGLLRWRRSIPKPRAALLANSREEVNERHSWQQIEETASSGDSAALSEAIVRWAALLSAGGVNSLQQLNGLLSEHNHELAEQLAAIEAAAFSDRPSATPATYPGLLKALRKQRKIISLGSPAKHKTGLHNNQLAELYNP